MCTDSNTWRIYVGEGAFELSYGDFGASLYHESVHYDQYLRGGVWRTEGMRVMKEIEVYGAMLDPGRNPFYSRMTPDSTNSWNNIYDG